MEFDNTYENESQIEIDNIPGVLPVLPLRDTVIFPYMIFPILVGREQSIRAVNYSLNTSKFIFLAAQKKPNVEDPKKEDIHLEGTIAKIIQTLKLPNGLMKILVDGIAHGRIINFTNQTEFFEGEIEQFNSPIEDEQEIRALTRRMGELFKEYIKNNKSIPKEVYTAYDNFEEIDRKLYYVAANINQSIELKQTILQKFTLREQIFVVIKILQSEIDILKIEKDIENKVQENMSKSQRKFLIQEQIRILKEELGEDDLSDSPDIIKLKEKIIKAKMPKEVEEKAMEELSKFNKIPPSSPEATVVRNYLDWLSDIPWYKKTKDNLDIDNVQKILDEDHYGLEKPKERIVEHIAVLNLVKDMKGQILCFVGPPGVGKTSLGRSIARALNRKFVRISLGGIRDEAEIRGHRRTYIGSMPGKIIQYMKRAGTINPVMLLDEIDKMSADFRGDPSSAMLEVLDPEQNHTFNDHYLDVDYDLSKVMFITTANVRYNIPLPLQDRMEIIELSSYLDYEKLQIAKRHIIPKQIMAHGLEKSNVNFTDEAIEKLINEYTREAGVRNLEREIASVLRKTAKEIVSNDRKKNKYEITPDLIAKFLGVPKFRKTQVEIKSQIGSVIGLAWTSVGGDILQVDASIMKGNEKLILTGQLGEVMKESAQAALSYLRANSKQLGLKESSFISKDIHIHLPAGAIPKDGPSAGITMACAMYSALSNKLPKKNIAMTGEITLRGNILAIGGLNEKLLAAKRYGIKTVIIPKENEIDLQEIKDEIKSGLKILKISTIGEAIKILFKGD